jgi:hypothetical protein
MNWCSVAVSIGEQLSEDGHVRPKHIAVECDFNAIFYVHSCSDSNDSLNIAIKWKSKYKRFFIAA